ncbi:MAG: DNA polymerase I [Phycisphaerae bacterium]|nr:DNA polymerase I [Phycisphaerae bacterium]
MSKSLYIIDGHAHIYSAHFAPMGGNLMSPDGRVTKTTYIFTNIILKILKDKKPDMIVVTMDAKGKTFRHDMYPDYKANRPPMPEEMPEQIADIKRILEAMNITVIGLEGYEADDLIGTLTEKADKDIEAFICSKDKDLEQLINDHVYMYDVKKDLTIDANALFEKKGIRPNQVVDVLALMGDTSDNIPGVKLVGPGVATQWIAEYDNLDNLLKNADKLKGKRGENLRAGLETLELSRKLVTINCDVPMEIDYDQFQTKEPDAEKLKVIFEELGFHKIAKQMSIDIDTPEPKMKLNRSSRPTNQTEATLFDSPTIPEEHLQYELIDSDDKFAKFYKKLKQQKVFAIDTETTGLNPVGCELVGISISWQSGTGYYIPLKAPLGQYRMDFDDIREPLAVILEDENIKKIGQNIKYDMIVLRNAGINLKGISFDTMIAAYTLDSGRNRFGMDAMAQDYLGHETIKISSLLGKGKKQITFDLVDTTMASDYAAEDADITWRLAEYIKKNFDDKDLQKLLDDVEIPLLHVLAKMEFNGIAINIPWLKKLNTQMSDQLQQLTEDIYKESGCRFNIDSPKQLSNILFETLGLKPTKKTKTGFSTDQEVLEELSSQHPVAAMMVQYRQLSKLKNTYVDTLGTMVNNRTGRIHCSFNQCGTATGRLSCSDPNLQNIPVRTEEGKKIRKAFIPGDKNNVLMAADYSQIELRLLAHFSQDEDLLKAFNNGQDIHRFVAAQVYGVAFDNVTSEMRSCAKAVNFGIIYGQGAFGLSRGTGMSVKEADKFIKDYFYRYSHIKDYMEAVIEDAKKCGYVQTILGRRRMLPDINSSNNNLRKMAERMAVNTTLQGSAADLIKVAMINIDKRITDENLDMKMLLQVHDELVFELPKDKAEDYGQIVRDEMIKALKLDVPLLVDVNSSENWLECK